DVFNPAEVVPEFTADHGVKKGEKVDYAIKLDGGIAILIECKPIGADLEAKHASQLFRYFSVTDARFSILTDGVRYVFFSDIEKPSSMDDRPLFEFNMLQCADSHVAELQKFRRRAFDMGAILSSGNNLKYRKWIISEVRAEFDSPTEDCVRLFAARV